MLKENVPQLKDNPSTKDVLNHPTKGIQQAQNPLTALWRKILFDLSIFNKRFSGLLNNYLVDPNNGIPDDPVARANHRGNLMKELGGHRITWQVFEKALRVIGVSQYQLVIRIKRKGITTEHVVYAQNNIQQEEQREDLSKARVIESFDNPVVIEENTLNVLNVEPRNDISTGVNSSPLAIKEEVSTIAGRLTNQVK